MTNFKTPLRGQQELTLLGSEKTTSSLVVFIFCDVCIKKILDEQNEKKRRKEQSDGE